MIDRIQRRVSAAAVDWLSRHPATVRPQILRRWIESIYGNPRDRSILVDHLKELMKRDAPPIQDFEPDAPLGEQIQFEDLAPLFASTTLNEYHITMNIRQSAYLFGLIRRMGATRVLETGRHWGGSTVLIAASMAGRGRFWSIADPHETDWDVKHIGRPRPRPIAAQLTDLLASYGLSAELVEASPAAAEVNTGELDLVHIDGDHTFGGAMGDFEKYGLRVRVGGAVLFDDAAPDPFSDLDRTRDVKRVVESVKDRGDFRIAGVVQRLVHFERTG